RELGAILMLSLSKLELRGVSPEFITPTQILFLSYGSVITTALALVAELGIADLLASGPRSNDDMAQATSTHPRSLYRDLRLLSGIGIFTELQPIRFALTQLGACLRSGVMRSWLRMVGHRVRLQTFAEALHSVRTGQPVFKHATGMEFFDYLAAHPDAGEI